MTHECADILCLFRKRRQIMAGRASFCHQLLLLAAPKTSCSPLWKTSYPEKDSRDDILKGRIFQTHRCFPPKNCSDPAPGLLRRPGSMWDYKEQVLNTLPAARPLLALFDAAAQPSHSCYPVSCRPAGGAHSV